MKLRIAQESRKRFVIEREVTAQYIFPYWVPLNIHGEEADDPDDIQHFKFLGAARTHAEYIIKTAKMYPVYHDIE